MRITLLILLLAPSTFFGQSTDKESILKCFANGFDVLENIREKKTFELDSIFEAATLKHLTELIEKNDERIYKDIYYDYRIDRYVFTVYTGQSIDNGTDWGLFTYDFVLTLFYKNQDGEITLVKTRTIFDDKQEKMAWWQSFMLSYNDSKFLRKHWADEYGLVPPPPPAPETSEWFEKK